jgi:putative addiction module killer protein
MAHLIRYRRDDGFEHLPSGFRPFVTETLKHAFRLRLRQAEDGNLGDVRGVGDGVAEFRIHVGAGYRVYFGQSGSTILILLCGGDKRRQSEDIRRAKQYWREWKGRNP